MNPEAPPTFEPGQEITQDDLNLTLRRPLGPGGHAWLATDHTSDEPVWVWRAPSSSWVELIQDALHAPIPSLPIYRDHVRYLGTTLVIVSAPGQTLCACDELLWEKLSVKVALDATVKLVKALKALKQEQISLAGIKRQHVHWDEKNHMLLITSMPHARAWVETDEELWRDIKLIGDLLFEKLLGRPCPGGHELAAILQDPIRMQEVGLTQPGLIQILAGCVTPYGEVAFSSHDQLIDSIMHLKAELDTPLRFEIATRSTMGISIFRKNNQDSCGYLELSHRCSSRTVTSLFACVADGIGGISHGERASALAVKTGCEVFTRLWSCAPAEELRAYPVDHARALTKVVSQRLAMEGEFAPGGNRGGTTFSAVIIAEDKLGIAHVGDSRIYLFRDGAIVQLTTDHTLATILDSLGELGACDPKPQDVRERTISRFLTTSMELALSHIDTFSDSAAVALGMNTQDALTHGVTLAPSDRLLLVSDGVHSGISHNDLLALSQKHAGAEALSQAVIDLSLDTMSRDNVTALVIEVLGV